MPSTDQPRKSGFAAVVVVALCCAAAVFEGFDLQAPGVTLPVLAPLFKLSDGHGQGLLAGFFSQKSLFLSISTFGLMLGAVVGGRLSDHFGRKWVLIGAVTIFGLLTVATAFSTSAEMLLVTRFLTGVGLGGALPNMIALVVENVSPERRNTAVGCLYASMPTGGALASVVAARASNPEQWPLVYLVGGLAPLVVAPLLALLLPRSPKVARAEGGAPKPAVLTALFGERRALTTLTLWVGFFTALMTMYVLLGWLPSLMVSRGLSRPEASTVQMFFNVFGAVGSVIAGTLIDRKKRQLNVALIYLVAMGALFVLASAPATMLVSIITGALVGGTISATQAILYALAPSCYPTAIRGTGVGFGVAVGRFGSAIGPLFAGALVGAGQNPTQVLTALLPLVAISGVAAFYLAHKTRASAFAAATTPAPA